MRLRFLGSIEVDCGGDIAVVTSTLSSTLLSVLAVQGRQVTPADMIISTMWEGHPAPSRNALQAVVVRLRRALGVAGGPVLRTATGGYTLDVDASDIDFRQFDLLLQEAKRIRKTEARRALDLIERARSIWSGTAFVGTRDISFLRVERSRLERLRADADELAAEIHLELGENAAALDDLWQLAEAYPSRERVAELLMIALFRTRQQEGALHVFHRTRRRLLDELGVDVSRSLRMIHHAVLTQDAVLDSPDVLRTAQLPAPSRLAVSAARR